MRKFNLSGQNLMEAALCLATISAVIFTMQLYVQRSLQARYRDGPRYLSTRIRQEGISKNLAQLGNLPSQYDPYYTQAWKEGNTTYSITSGFPDSTISQETKERAWQRVHVPGDAD